MNTETEKVADLGTAAALVTFGAIIQGTHIDQSGRVYFEFKKSKSLSKLIDDYRANKFTVKARAYHDNLKMLKGLIYAER